MFLVIGYFAGVVFPVSNFLDKNIAVPNQAKLASYASTDQASSQVLKIGLPPFAIPLGSDSAQLNIVEFGDYQCPYCERFFQDTEPLIMQDYVNTGKAKFYFLDFTIIGPDSLTLSNGAWCAADQNKYYEYHHYVYSHQGEENSGWGMPEKVKALASNISGLDMQQFDACLDSKKYESRVQQLTQFGQRLGITGTPTIFIGNNEKGYLTITGAQPYDVVKQVIDKQLG
ncbi:MAG: thioredoxin domain-containing protein [Thaumarchaeota archaeon]|nr:thioredoxin domain-containing protein [Nitrososphaerota archaeon]